MPKNHLVGVAKHVKQFRNLATAAYVRAHPDDPDLGDINASGTTLVAAPTMSSGCPAIKGMCFDEKQHGLNNADMKNALMHADTAAVRGVLDRWPPDSLALVPFPDTNIDSPGMVYTGHTSKDGLNVRVATRYAPAGLKLEHAGSPAPGNFARYANSKSEQIAREIMHETGHVFLDRSSIAKAALEKVWAAATPVKNPITQRAVGPAEEYFAECFALYNAAPKFLKTHDEVGYDMIYSALTGEGLLASHPKSPAAKGHHRGH